MSKKKSWLEDHAPLGINVHSEVTYYAGGVTVATIQSMGFLFRYGEARRALYEVKAGKPVLIEGAVIKDFASLTENMFLLAVVVCVVTLLASIFYYMYHYQGSKMMYLMKRLPDKWEVYRRCLTLPIAGATLMAVWAFVLRMIYYAIYILCTPNQCLPL